MLRDQLMWDGKLLVMCLDFLYDLIKDREHLLSVIEAHEYIQGESETWPFYLHWDFYMSLQFDQPFVHVMEEDGLHRDKELTNRLFHIGCRLLEAHERDGKPGYSCGFDLLLHAANELSNQILKESE